MNQFNRGETSLYVRSDRLLENQECLVNSILLCKRDQEVAAKLNLESFSGHHFILIFSQRNAKTQFLKNHCMIFLRSDWWLIFHSNADVGGMGFHRMGQSPIIPMESEVRYFMKEMTVLTAKGARGV
ncbi:MAG: hypothetical protein EA361_09930 [Bacteroidetes bacterium]|nr:MAG: hypothetical protein EA361_09930 [Bacteroidota bacterium]